MTDEQNARYMNAMHRMQSAIALDATRMGHDSDVAAGSYVKHMRVGIDSAHASLGGLSRLLIQKGVITIEEYYEAIVVGSEREADLQVERVRQKYDLPEGMRFA